jgi:hypothetical protein
MPPHPWLQENLENVHITLQQASLRPFLLGMISHLGIKFLITEPLCMFMPHLPFSLFPNLNLQLNCRTSEYQPYAAMRPA